MTTTTLSLPTSASAVGAGAEMKTIHSAFRRELRLAPQLLRSVGHGDRLRAGIVGVHLDLLDRFLHHHHSIEDDMLWPRLLERVSTEIAPVVEMMEDQHHVVAALLEQTVAARTEWRLDADRARADELAEIYTQLHASLVEHLDAEEQHVMPLVEVCITAKEWGKLSRIAQRSMPLKDGPRVLGMLAYDGDPEVMTHLLGSVPAPLRGVVLTTGRRAYAKHAMRVYGTATP